MLRTNRTGPSRPGQRRAILSRTSYSGRYRRPKRSKVGALLPRWLSSARRLPVLVMVATAALATALIALDRGSTDPRSVSSDAEQTRTSTDEAIGVPETDGTSEQSSSPEGPESSRATPPSRSSHRPPSVPEAASGTFAVAAKRNITGTVPADATTYQVEVENGLPFRAGAVAQKVDATLGDPRGWSTAHTLARITKDADVRIKVASPKTTDRLCAPLDTGGRLSCRNQDLVVINAWRWVNGARSYAGDIDEYRRYVINHEVGHALGYPHVPCPQAGSPAPVMLQQTKGLQGCTPNPWPTLVDLTGAH